MLYELTTMRIAGTTMGRVHLDQLLAVEPTTLYPVAEPILLKHVDAAWQAGWQPSELHRQARLGCTVTAGTRLAHVAMAADHANRRAAELDPRWIAQVEDLDLPDNNGRRGWLQKWVNDEQLSAFDAVDAILDVIANVVQLPTLDPILTPPGSDRVGAVFVGAPVGAEADPILERIRNLLAKAESTTFEAEATALTAKAQELMTRYAIDAAVLQSSSDVDDQQPVAIRVPIDAPYADIKSLLLQTVAGSSRCRTVFLKALSLSTVMGYPDDVAAVQVLFTSLLVQAQTAVAEAARNAPAGTRTRSRSYRSTFLFSYTTRIGDRLREINDAVYAEAEEEVGAGFLPVLRSRSARVNDFMAERFADAISSPVKGGYDSAGWAGGRIAADNARLHPGDLEPGAGTGTWRSGDAFAGTMPAAIQGH